MSSPISAPTPPMQSSPRSIGPATWDPHHIGGSDTYGPAAALLWTQSTFRTCLFRHLSAGDLTSALTWSKDAYAAAIRVKYRTISLVRYRRYQPKFLDPVSLRSSVGLVLAERRRGSLCFVRVRGAKSLLPSRQSDRTNNTADPRPLCSAAPFYSTAPSSYWTVQTLYPS